MARNGSGTYANPYPNFVSGTVISSTETDANNSDIATALTQSIAVDGQTTVTANLPMNSQKFTGLAVGTVATDSVTLGQVQAEAFVWCGTAGGSADAITLSPSPAITAYAAGQRFVWMASSSVNTGATTVAISGLTAIALQDNGAALVAGNHAASKMFMGILNTTSTVQIMQVQSSGTDPLIISSLTVDGNSQFNGTVTVGIDGTGKDVKFFGDTASAYLLWDESADKLLTAGGALIDIVKDKLMIGGVAVTTTAAELNILDGVTSTTAELNILDGVTSTTAELNILDGVTSTAAELNILDGVTSTTAELNLIDGGTARGTTAVASGDGILINDAGTMAMTNVDTVSTYFSSHSVGGGNIVTVGALNAGSITSGFTSIDVGAGAITTTGVITGGTVEATTDTSAGDNAAIGYTSAEGLILTGQGSTSDVVIQNDTGTTVFSIATGTTNVTIAGDLTISGDDLKMGTNTSGAALIADGTGYNPVVISGDISINTSGVAAIGSGVVVEADIADNAVTLAKMAGLARGKIIYGDASGDPAALTVGSANQVLVSDGTDAAWGTVSVAGGGTGATSLTDGGVLLGSATGAVTAMAVLSDGQMIVGDGSTDPVAESGATLRTSIGVGTGDSPQFTAINVGAASDTTIARSGAGDITVEGNAVYRAGGTDVPVADGGTGASTLTDGGLLVGSGTGAITAMSVLAKGTVVVGDGTTDPTTLAAGTNDYVLTTDSGEASGLKWASSPTAAISSYTNSANNRIITSVDSSTVNGEANLTFDGSVLAATGNITATGTVEPAGDTAASDNAAIGYTSAEGLILTGQGSTNDVTIKNDADATVISIPTGTTNVTIAGDLTISGDDLTMGTNTSGAALIADGTNFNPVVISGDISINTSGVAAIGSGVIVEADIADNAVTLAKMAGGTDGVIITYDASGNPTHVGPGSDGQVLTSTGAGSPPAFEDAGGGGGGATDINGLSDAITNSSGATVGLGTGALANDDGSTNNNTALGFNSLNTNTTGDKNIATGYRALYANTTGSRNSATGYQALEENTTGYYNTADGYYALTANTTGYENTAFGYYAHGNNTTGNTNTSVGRSASQSNTTGSSNTATGYSALSANTTASNNTATGYQALYANTTGYDNTATGAYALKANTTGYHNVATGRDALYANTTGYDNTATGYRALYANTTGGANTAFGAYALKDNTTGWGNSGFGQYELYLNTTGYANTALGYYALQDNTTGFYNTALGYQAGDVLTTGSNNTSLGYQADPSSLSATNEVTLGNSSVTAIRCQVQSISSLSDRRDKKSIKELPVGLDFINDLKPVKFVWNMRDGAKKGIQEIGFIAQDLDESQINAGAEDYLNLVLKNNPDKLEASYGKLVPILVKAVQELSAEINNLKEKLNT
jgi:hypothetical protein